ncbi:hypothetical protein BHM03_00053658 [Ensete ventricosum]|nr:hypothetical protein BHM03_00053658 [Ensete ventricosum]
MRDERDGFGAATPPSLLRPLLSSAGRGVGVINPWKDPTVGVALSAETEIPTVGFHGEHSDSDSDSGAVAAWGPLLQHGNDGDWSTWLAA